MSRIPNVFCFLSCGVLSIESAISSECMLCICGFANQNGVSSCQYVYEVYENYIILELNDQESEKYP